jgi:hypothetical protein
MLPGELLACAVDGTITSIPNTYEAIKEALNGATITFVRFAEEAGFYVDDEGMLNELPLNVPASMTSFGAYYGPVVLVGPPDDEGETQPCCSAGVEMLTTMGGIWRTVVAAARGKGQDPYAKANPDTIPLPRVYGFSTEQFFQFLATGRLPDEPR